LITAVIDFMCFSVECHPPKITDRDPPIGSLPHSRNRDVMG
jgi:hypothetical protein